MASIRMKLIIISIVGFWYDPIVEGFELRLRRCQRSEVVNIHPEMLPSHIFYSQRRPTSIKVIDGKDLECPSLLPGSLPLYSEIADLFGNEDAEVPEPKFNGFFADGFLRFNSSYFSPKEFCVQNLEDSNLHLQICNISCPDPSGQRICVTKCCQFGKELQDVDGNPHCVDGNENETPSTGEWKPLIHKSEKLLSCIHSKDTSPSCIKSGISRNKFHFQSNFKGCPDEDNYTMEFINFEVADHIFGFTGDTIVVDGLKTHIVIQHGDFCIEGLRLNSSEETLTHGAVICLPNCNSTDPYEYKRKVIGYFYVSVMFISAVFLFLTIIVYILIWDKHNVHGWTVFALSISMAFMFIFLGSARVISSSQFRQQAGGSLGCKFVGVAAHFFFLTTFSLLTCLSFDLWWTFRTLAPSVGKSKGILRLNLYLLFSIGFPLLIIIIGISLDAVYGNLTYTLRRQRGLVLPEYGIETCFISDKISKGLYIYLPAAVLLLTNLIFFCTTMWIMWQYHQNTQRARQNNSRKQKQTFYLFMKLFLVMGVTWIVEVIEYLTEYNRVEKDERGCDIIYPPGVAWLITDLFNIAQGFCIFAIFVCKKQVMLHLSRRHPTIGEIVRPVFSTPCCKLDQFDLEGPSGKTNQSSVSMRTFTTRQQKISPISQDDQSSSEIVIG